MVKGTVNFGYDNAINTNTTSLLASIQLNYTCTICNDFYCGTGQTVTINEYTKVDIPNNQSIRLKVYFNCTSLQPNCGLIGEATYMDLNSEKRSSCIINYIVIVMLKYKF